MSKDIKFLLKEAANRQEISDLSDKIISNVDVTKINRPSSIKAPRRIKVFPLILGVMATALVVTTTVITSLSGTNSVNTVTYSDITMSSLQRFYSDFTVNDTPNMINIVNTFNNISYEEVDGRVVDGDKKLKLDMENAIVNDLNAFIFNIEDMLGLENNDSLLTANTNPLYDYKYLVTYTNTNNSYYIYYDETVVEEKNIEKDNYKYKADLIGEIILGDNSYLFTGEKRIKNSKLSYVTNIKLSDDKNVRVSEVYTINPDFTINYNQFEYNYSYTNLNETKNIEIVQKFGADGEVSNVRFIANRGRYDEYKLTFTNDATRYIKGAFDSRDKYEIYISKNNSGYTYTFKNSNNTYLK